MSRFLKSTVAALALGVVVGGPIAGFAQTADTAPAAETTAARQLPQVVQDLGLSDVKMRDARNGGVGVQGKLSDGTTLRAFVDAKGSLLGARVDKGQALPDALVQQVLPEAVRANEVFKQFSTVSGAFGGERGVMISGSDADGEGLRAAFSQDGTLMRYGRGEGVKPHKKGHHGADRGKHFSSGKHLEQRKMRGKDHGRKAMALSDQAIKRVMEASGYTDLGAVSRAAPRALVDAKNPQGEAVQVEISPHGDVIREIAK